MRTIAELLNLDGRVYVYVPSKNIRSLFLKNAQEEDFRFADGVKSTRRRAYDDIYVLNKDFTINYVGYIRHIAFHHPSNFDDDKLIRIDYAAYLSGAKNYIIRQKRADFQKSRLKLFDFLFKISKCFGIKEIDYCYIQTITDFLNRGYAWIFTLVIYD